MILNDLLAPTYRNLLTALSHWLDKAVENAGGDAILSARLADDMFPLATQIRFACVQALEGVSRSSGVDLPDSVSTLLDEGRNAGEAPGTIRDAQARIRETLATVDSMFETQSGLEASAQIAHELPNGMIFDLTAEQYVRDWAIPQFYFHLMAAYAILRGQGVPLGKIDYVAHMLPFLREGTAPQA